MRALQITFINVGYGEAIYLECPDNDRPGGVFTMLIDGGSAEAAEFAQSTTGRITAADYLRRTGAGPLDVMVATHLHEDHLCGLLPVAQAQLPRALWQTFAPDFTPKDWPAGEEETASARKFRSALRDYGVLKALLSAGDRPIRQLCAGDSLPLCPGLTVQVLGPDRSRMETMARRLLELEQETDKAVRRAGLAKADAEMNNHSLILLLDYHGTKILLPGDTNSLGFRDLESLPQVSLFKVGHHGQRDGVDEGLLRKIAPTHVVCCASSDRRYGSADPERLELMRRQGATLYFSDCPEEAVPPHHALTFSIGENGDMQAAYRQLPEEYDAAFLLQSPSQSEKAKR